MVEQFFKCLSDDTLERWCKVNFMMFSFVLTTQEAEVLIFLNFLGDFCTRLFRSSVSCYIFYLVEKEIDLYIKTKHVSGK